LLSLLLIMNYLQFVIARRNDEAISSTCVSAKCIYANAQLRDCFPEINSGRALPRNDKFYMLIIKDL
jgi:hypothetical protein